ncbi:radical SAM protein [Geoalkalibacter sp.]|uniref:radical SAM protein n=1 Tax=Geoalkalibacter sp. TaxID=3041440 RepID=UPI00272DE9FB|nr:radical SAM protein [Geoalkalibacter sp.]
MTQEQLIARNREEYGERYAALTFPTPDQAVAALARRDALLEFLSGRVAIGCGGTKLDCNRLSPGCAVCVAGRWSCLFINGQCNCACFYCPSAQNDIGRPVTNSLEFRTPADYVDYLAAFGFTGASFSGGEPLLTPERTLSYLKAAKQRFGAALHVWLYTNGTLVTPEILGQLRDAGLDEIRFDIGATDYHLNKAALAVGVIPCVTVEIPAVPEKYALLRDRIAAMAECGIAHLNLHQLRLTPYNFERFQGRGYTFLHGEKVTVLESELCALELMRDGLERGIDLPINYCSFVYKNRYQAQAARLRNGALARKSHEALTAAGYIRTLCLTGPREAILAQAERLHQADAGLWQLSRAKDRLSVHPTLAPLLAPDGLELRLNYAEAVQRPAVSYRFPFVEVPINATRKIVIERRPACGEILLAPERGADLLRALAVGMDLAGFAELRPFEAIKTGLQAYF